jgi:hypothetical protein
MQMAKFLEVTTRYQALKIAPWAAVIAKVAGGFLAFEFNADYATWRRQK